MFKRYEAEAIHEYDDLVASGGDFDALANHRVDEVQRPGDKEQFRKERAAELCSRGAPGTPGGGLDVERQHLCQTQSEEQQDYSRQRDEEIKAREGGTPSPVIYNTSSPSVGTPGAPIRQKKKILFAEYQSRLPREDPDQSHTKEEAEWHEKLKKQQEEVEFRQSEVNRLKREWEELAQEQECLRTGQEQLDCLRAEQELLRNERLECQCLEKEQREHHRLEKEAKGVTAPGTRRERETSRRAGALRVSYTRV